MKGLFIILVLFFFTACTSSNNDNAHSVLPILDLSKEYPEKKIDICEIADVENFPAFIFVDDKGNDFFKQLKPWTPCCK